MVGVAQLAASEVEEVKAVGGGRVCGAGRELPPPLNAVRDIGEAEQAGEVQRAIHIGGLFGDPRRDRVCVSSVAAGFGRTAVSVFGKVPFEQSSRTR
ncbi:hypothetical protein ACIA6D_30545 [Streptomyces cacaoi]